MKKMLKYLLRQFALNVPVRGRHRLVNVLGKALSSDVELLNINGFNIHIDHKELWCRNMYYGVYEEHLINFIKRNITAGDIVLDPGTNLGFITAHLLGKVGKEGHIYAFEPSKTCFKLLSENNDLTAFNNLSLHNAAIGNENSEMFFIDTPLVISRGYSFLESVDTAPTGDRYKIPTYGIDAFCSERGIKKIKFLKLDIEGAELLALQGATNYLHKGAIDFVLVETTIDENNESLTERNKAIHKILRSNNYKAFSIKRNGKLQPINLDNKVLFRADIMWALSPQ